MSIIARGQSSHGANPILSTYFVVGGVIIDPVEIEFAIFTTQPDPVQVYPADPELRAVVDLSDAPLGDRLAPGHYAAVWDVPSDAAVGRYEIRWWYRLSPTDVVEWTFTTQFEVVTRVAVSPLYSPIYASVASMRDEGYLAAAYADDVMHRKLMIASRLFSQYTGRSFVPSYKVVRSNGRGTSAIGFEEPIIGVLSVHLEYEPNFELDPGITLASLRVYNRHLTQGLLDPDDREEPRIEYSMAAMMGTPVFTPGRQNVTVRGIFGYTDPDGSPVGAVPHLVAHCVRLLAVKDLPKLSDAGGRDDSQKRWRLTGESTRDQSYTMFGGVDAATRGALVGGTTGDPEIDNIILLYRRGPRLGAA